MKNSLKNVNAKCKIKKGDTVIVLSGKDKTKTGEVLFVYPRKSSVVVKGINVFKKHTKPSQINAGGIIEKEMPMNISKVAYYENSKAVKIGYKIEDGRKVRFSKSTGKILD